VTGADGEQAQQQLYGQGGLAHARPAGDDQPAVGEGLEVVGEGGDIATVAGEDEVCLGGDEPGMAHHGLVAAELPGHRDRLRVVQRPVAGFGLPLLPDQFGPGCRRLPPHQPC
jgi:hypothetical protein